jgi:hypothetical protein
MPTPYFSIKQGDTLPTLTATLVGADGVTPQVLTGATVRLSLRAKDQTLVLNRVPCTIVNAAAGQVSYAWQPTDTAVARTLTGEFEVTFADASILTFPNDTGFMVAVVAQVN